MLASLDEVKHPLLHLDVATVFNGVLLSALFQCSDEVVLEELRVQRVDHLNTDLAPYLLITCF